MRQGPTNRTPLEPARPATALNQERQSISQQIATAQKNHSAACDTLGNSLKRLCDTINTLAAQSRSVAGFPEGFSHPAALKFCVTSPPKKTIATTAAPNRKVGATRADRESNPNPLTLLLSPKHLISNIKAIFVTLNADLNRAGCKEYRDGCVTLSTAMSEMAEKAGALLPSSQSTTTELSSLAYALAQRFKSQSGSGSRGKTEESSNYNTLPTRQLLSEMKRVALKLSEDAFRYKTDQAPEVKKIMERHLQFIDAHTKMPAPHFTPLQSLLLSYLSLRESLRSNDLRDSTRDYYNEQATIAFNKLTTYTLKTINKALSGIRSVGKEIGQDLIPKNIEEDFLREIAPNHSQPSTPEAKMDTTGEAELASFIKDCHDDKITAALNDKIKVGTVRATLTAIDKVLNDLELARAILKINPLLFLDYQDNKTNFLKFTRLLETTLPLIERAKAQKSPPSPARLASFEAIGRWIKSEKARAFKAEKDEMLGILRQLYLPDPELALTVLRYGCLVRGHYHSVAEDRFNDFARRGLLNDQKKLVAEVRDSLHRVKLLAITDGGEISLATSTDPQINKLLYWIRNNLPTSEQMYNLENS